MKVITLVSIISFSPVIIITALGILMPSIVTGINSYFPNAIPEASVDNDTDMLAHLVEHTYDQGQGYEMTLNDTKIYGFRCANHKMNIAIREAIKMHQPILDLLKKLNKSNSHVRRSIELNSIFKNNKCRLRLENNTRWSSAYLLLESVKRAYDKNMFEDIDDRRCPIK